MPSLKHNSSSVIILDLASKMKMGNLKKAAAMCKSKTGVLAARLLVLASLRRRMATVGAISHRIHALMVATESGKDLDKALVPRKAKAGGGKPVVLVRRRNATDISDQLALFHQEDGDGGDGPDWSVHSIFDDENCCYADEYEGDDDDGSELLDVCDDGHDASEPSVMDVIRSNRKVEGLEFNVDDEIDRAAGIFITRFWNRRNGSI
ncbi:hypothetical protein CFC21_066689 [Triticum aestivum]|uniref:Uncharacterized protein n=4 Tax=Triticum TaxID=4564 RepID=A0A9R0TWB3_TRITD|nr:hypothetical protein TRIUR3_00837 [Triticum urartu]KAF7059836.1 hypothetical protein CFC21_066689 [Triticum aestivum]VAI19660.1 unnamed protein product [Triticum turgidum subsp. durum]